MMVCLACHSRSTSTIVSSTGKFVILGYTDSRNEKAVVDILQKNSIHCLSNCSVTCTFKIDKAFKERAKEILDEDSRKNNYAFNFGMN